jgi:hypothetical protein
VAVEGDWFLVASHGWHDQALGVGLVARAPRRTGAAFLYVFGPFKEEPSDADLAMLQPDERLMVCLTPTDVVGDLPVIWHDESFSRERWPMPWFSINSGIPEFPIDAVRTSDDDPFAVIETRPVSPHDARELPEYGTTSITTILEKLQHPDLPLPRLSDRF